MPKSLEKVLMRKQSVIPTAVGSRNAASVHFKLPVSFFTVSNEVEQGQWKSVKTTVQSAVVNVHPFASKIVFTEDRLSYSTRLPDCIYAMSTIGITISFAGNPRINAMRIIPSSPMSLAIGLRKSAQ